MVSIGAHVTGGRRALALELLNLYASTSVVLECLFPQGRGWPRAQYLLPVRATALAAFGGIG